MPLQPKLRSPLNRGMVPGSYAPAPVLPTFNPQVATDLSGGFWNAVGGAPKPIAFGNIGGLAQGAMAPQVNNQVLNATPNDGGIAGILKSLMPQSHHFGIGGAEITDSNPFGNPGGDPFKNGFFKPTVAQPGMSYLTGTPNPDPTQLAMIQAAKLARTTTPQIPLAQGDPQARAFWAKMGM